MSDLTAEIYEIAKSIRREPSDEELAGIAAIARKQQKLERAVARREKLLKLTQEKLARVSELELPDAMAVIGMEDFRLSNGSRVTVKKEYYANLPSADSDKEDLLARRRAAFQWMRDTGNEDLIKNQIVAEAGKGQDEQAQRAIDALTEVGIMFTRTESIHASTLKAFVKEQLEKQAEAEVVTNPFPEKTFGVHVKRVASVKPASKK